MNGGQSSPSSKGTLAPTKNVFGNRGMMMLIVINK